jgi:hypothetical protein
LLHHLAWLSLDVKQGIIKCQVSGWKVRSEFKLQELGIYTNALPMQPLFYFPDDLQGYFFIVSFPPSDDSQDPPAHGSCDCGLKSRSLDPFSISAGLMNAPSISTRLMNTPLHDGVDWGWVLVWLPLVWTVSGQFGFLQVGHSGQFGVSFGCNMVPHPPSGLSWSLVVLYHLFHIGQAHFWFPGVIFWAVSFPSHQIFDSSHGSPFVQDLFDLILFVTFISELWIRS